WEPGTQYNPGDIVEYEGHRYKIIQAHLSQGDWTPDRTPALWGRLQDSDHGFGGGEYRPPQPQNPPNYNYGHDSANNEKPVYQPPQEQQEVHREEQKKHWYDLDGDRKKQLEVGGALLGGLAVLGAGYYAYKEHNKSEDEKKALTWGLQQWLDDAQRRKNEFYNNGPRAPATWVLTQNHDIPAGALPVGNDGDGNALYAARAFHEGGVHVGYASPTSKKGAVISYGGDDANVNMYEILLADPNGVHWERHRGTFRPQDFLNPPVDGGWESNRTPIAVARVEHHGWRIPGKASAGVDGANFAYKGKE
ncbi:carbohydrate-binding module family 12 protein, partial [Vararia minispora EC-137]